MVVVLKPLEEDPGGKNYQESVFKTGREDEALSGGNAWRALLQGDPTPEGESEDETPVSRDPATGREDTWAEFL